ncbi:MAG: GTP-binding protein TypA [Chloroflexi bacterium]|nr:GTP-binding protein TypA [Chloroflexota bacterium]
MIDTIEPNIGPVTEELSRRSGYLTNHFNDGKSNVRLEYRVPTRGLIGFRSVFLTLTRGEGVVSSLLAGYEPLGQAVTQSRNGALVATNMGSATTYGLNNAQERGSTFVEPGLQVYEGMVVGLSRYPYDVPVNICKEKKQTNIRSSTSDIAVRLSPPVQLSLEESLAWIEDDELVEVTPTSVRLRKRILTNEDRLKARKDSQGRK